MGSDEVVVSEISIKTFKRYLHKRFGWFLDYGLFWVIIKNTDPVIMDLLDELQKTFLKYNFYIKLYKVIQNNFIFYTNLAKVPCILNGFKGNTIFHSHIFKPTV